MNSKISNIVFFVIMFSSLTSCINVEVSSTAQPHFTNYSTLVPATPTNVLPVQSLYISFTASPEQIIKWREYEYALASRLLFLHPPEDIICEWEILGQVDEEIYVWAYCLGLPPSGMSENYAPAASIPAVIHINLGGSIQSVELPRDQWDSYAEGIQNIFPNDLHEKIFKQEINITELISHAKLRRANPSPPLIIQLSTP